MEALVNATVKGSDWAACHTDDPGSNVLSSSTTGNEKQNIFQREYISRMSTMQYESGARIHELL